MRINKHDGSDEKIVLTGMIVDNAVCGRIVSKWNKELFKNKWSNLIALWCKRYFDKYEKAPRGHIQSQFERWAEKNSDESTTNMIEKFLAGLSDDWQELKRESNSDYILDIANKHFSLVQTERLRDDIDNCVLDKDPDKAQQIITGYNRINISAQGWIDPLNDKLAMQKALDTESNEPLIRYPGALGKFFGDRLERDGLICFEGPEKRGKCISADMLIPLADGRIKTIEWIVKNKNKTPILTLNEKTQRLETTKISHFYDNGWKGCWKVVTKTGRSVITTENHKYLTPDGWKELSEIGPGSFIAVPKRISVFGNCMLYEPELKFLGYMLADGGCTGYQANFTKTDSILVNDFHSCCDSLGIEHRRKGITTYLLRAGNLRRKYSEALWKVTSKEKRIPNVIFQCTKEQISLFLKIFFSCDGYINEIGNCIELALANKKMCQQISHLLHRFGIVHKFMYFSSKCKDKYFKAWKITIRNQENVNLFLNEIGFMSYKSRKLIKAKPDRSLLDKFPWQVAKQFHDEARRELTGDSVVNLKRGSAYYKQFTKAPTIREQIAKKCPLMRQSFSELIGTKAYAKFMNSDILWDEIVKVVPVGKKKTYDLAISKHHNFIANDCLVHNSFWLMDMVFRGIEQRRRVAYFQVGDLSRDQIMRRIAVRVAEHPLKASEVMWPKKILFSNNADGKRIAKTSSIPLAFIDNIDWRMAMKASQEFQKKRMRSFDNYLRLSVHPNNTLSVPEIKSAIVDWSRQGWVADVVVIDYSDILRMDYYGLEGRDRINQTWMDLRQLSQIFHCLVVTATQTSAASYKAETVGKVHFSEDKRKRAHTTGNIGINQTEDEKKQGIMRLNWIQLRESAYLESQCVYVAGCPALANLAVRSSF